ITHHATRPMPHSPSAAKRLRKAEKRRRQNRAAAKKLKGHRKALTEAVKSGDTAKTGTEFQNTQAALDRAATKGYIHPNKAARLKSRLSKRPKATAAKT